MYYPTTTNLENKFYFVDLKKRLSGE